MLDADEEQEQTNRLRKEFMCFLLVNKKGNYDILGQHTACKHTSFKGLIELLIALLTRITDLTMYLHLKLSLLLCLGLVADLN